jgi:hypothetical protein
MTTTLLADVHTNGAAGSVHNSKKAGTSWLFEIGREIIPHVTQQADIPAALRESLSRPRNQPRMPTEKSGAEAISWFYSVFLR